MRWVVLLLLMLLVTGWLATQVKLPTSSHFQPPETMWRRTSNGWEHPMWLFPEPKQHPPALHPLSVGLLQLLFSPIGFLFSTPLRLRKVSR